MWNIDSTVNMTGLKLIGWTHIHKHCFISIHHLYQLAAGYRFSAFAALGPGKDKDQAEQQADQKKLFAHKDKKIHFYNLVI